MIKAKLLFVCLLLMITAACSDTTTVPVGSEATGQNGVLSATLTNSTDPDSNIIEVGSSAIISVKLVDGNGAAIANEQINFNSDKGVISTDSRLTNASGETTFSIATANVAVGIVTATIDATIDEETLSVDLLFEVTDSTTIVDESAELTLTIISAEGVTTNRIQALSNAQLQATLLDSEGVPLADLPVTFTAELGTLQATSSLTNSEGIASVNLTASDTLGAGYASALVDISGSEQTTSLAYEIIAGQNIEGFSLGYFDDSDTFVPDQINTNVVADDGSSTINAGSTLGLEFVIVDEAFEPIKETIVASFTSSCVARGKATIDENVESINGVIQATYKDISCAGTQGNEDTITATVSVNSTNYFISHDIHMLPEDLGSIEFISASPESIVIKGTGGQGKQEVSTLTFLVKGELGNPVNNQEVTFELTSTVGGVQLVENTGITDSDGLASAIVKSGTVPTAVRVNASVITEDEVVISTQSDLLSINTGLPDQDSITMAFSEINPEALNFAGKQVTVTAYMADSFNNPVPDGTTINFTTEGGSIESFCHTEGGSCSVQWTSQEPYLDNHRATVLAYAIGHEYFVDVNGNNIMDEGDGTAANANISNMAAVDAGFQRPDSVVSSGYFDLQEAWRDDNENNTRDPGELFIDFNNNGTHDAGDGFFNGPQCMSDTLCPDTANDLITIRKAGVIIVASSDPYISVVENTNAGDVLLLQNYGSPTTSAATSISRGSSAFYTASLSDTAMQTLPVGTVVTISSTAGEITGWINTTIGNTVGTTDPNGFGGINMPFTLKNDVDEPDIATVNISVSLPSGLVTETWFTVVLE